jgi:regulator of replication initiation timing
LPDYFRLPKGNKRTNFISEQILSHLSPIAGWTVSRVGAWFRNNKAKSLHPPAPRANRVDLASKDDLLHATDGLQDRLRQIEGRLDEIHRDVAAMQETVGSTHEQNVALQKQLSDLQSAMMAEISTELKTIAQQLPHLPSPEVVKERTAQFFSETNQPLRLVDHPAFKRWVDMIAPGVELPTSPELRQAILGQAQAFRESITPDSVGSSYISLMTDGSTMAGRKWLGVSLATSRAFLFWRALSMKNNEGKTIAQSLADVVKELTAKKFIICAVVTDNASNEIAAVRQLADQSKRPIVRIPCLSHTLNLAAQDFFTVVFGKDVFPGHLRLLYHALPTASEGDAFYGLDSICLSRWLSFGKFVHRLVTKRATAFERLAPGTAAGDILRAYEFDQLDACFEVVNGFMTATESQLSFLDGAFWLALQACYNLTVLHQKGNIYALPFHEAVRERLTSTADLGQLLLGFLVTERGLNWYHHLPKVAEPGVFSQRSVRARVQVFLDHFVDVFEANPVLVNQAFDVYLTSMKWPVGQSAVHFWLSVWEIAPKEFSRNAASYRWMATMALILMRMPCSESEVERMFSRMRIIFGKRSKRIKRDLLEARLVLQMNGPKKFLQPEMKRVLKKFEEEEEEERPLKVQTPPRVPDVPDRVEFTIPILPGTARVVTDGQDVSPVPPTFDPLPITRPGGETAPPARFSPAPLGRTVKDQTGRKPGPPRG